MCMKNCQAKKLLLIAEAMSFMIESDTGSESIIDPQCIIDIKHVR